MTYGISANTSIGFGVSNTNYNTAFLQFNYNGNNSQTNTIGLGFYNANNLLTIDAFGVCRIANNSNNKKFVLYDNNFTESAVSGVEFHGFGVGSSLLRYNVPTGCSHNFYAGSSSLLCSISDSGIVLNKYLSINNSIYCNSVNVRTSTTINTQGGYMEWNRSGGGGELEITNQVGGGTDNSIYFSKSDASNNRTKMWQFFSSGITNQISGNTFMEIAGGGSWIFGYYTACSFQVYNAGVVQLSITSAGCQMNSANISTLSSTSLVSNSIRSLTGLRIDGWGSTNYSIECFASQSVSSSATVNVGYNMIFKSSSGTSVGSISNNGSNATYSISSDYRVKKNVVGITNALETISKLKPCNYQYRSNDHQAQGFIAHELQEVLPYCVVGEKDGVNDKGEMIVQGVDYSMLTPILTKGIQELVLENVELKERLSLLEKLMNSKI
jgi:hypothetical protein